MAAVIFIFNNAKQFMKGMQFCNHIYSFSWHTVALHTYGAWHDEAHVKSVGWTHQGGWYLCHCIFLCSEALKTPFTLQAGVASLLPDCCSYPPAILSPALLPHPSQAPRAMISLRNEIFMCHKVCYPYVYMQIYFKMNSFAQLHILGDNAGRWHAGTTLETICFERSLL